MAHENRRGFLKLLASTAVAVATRSIPSTADPKGFDAASPGGWYLPQDFPTEHFGKHWHYIPTAIDTFYDPFRPRDWITNNGPFELKACKDTYYALSCMNNQGVQTMEKVTVLFKCSKKDLELLTRLVGHHFGSEVGTTHLDEPYETMRRLAELHAIPVADLDRPLPAFKPHESYGSRPMVTSD